MSTEQQWIVIVGSIHTGFRFIGPMTRDQAEELYDEGSSEKWITLAALEPPPKHILESS